MRKGTVQCIMLYSCCLVIKLYFAPFTRPAACLITCRRFPQPFRQLHERKHTNHPQPQQPQPQSHVSLPFPTRKAICARPVRPGHNDQNAIQFVAGPLRARKYIALSNHPTDRRRSRAAASAAPAKLHCLCLCLFASRSRSRAAGCARSWASAVGNGACTAVARSRRGGSGSAPSPWGASTGQH